MDLLVEEERVDEGGGGDRSKPTFMAALRMRILRRVRLMSSAPVAVFAVLAVDDVLFEPSEYPLSWLELLLHRAGRPESLPIPNTIMFGIDGELSSGDIGVSSNSVHGVSGSRGRGSTRLSSEGSDDIELMLLFDFVLGRLLLCVSVLLEAPPRLCIS